MSLILAGGTMNLILVWLVGLSIICLLGLLIVLMIKGIRRDWRILVGEWRKMTVAWKQLRTT